MTGEKTFDKWLCRSEPQKPQNNVVSVVHLKAVINTPLVPVRPFGFTGKESEKNNCSFAGVLGTDGMQAAVGLVFANGGAEDDL